jgi:hypothetical protein
VITEIYIGDKIKHINEDRIMHVENISSKYVYGCYGNKEQICMPISFYLNNKLFKKVMEH